MKKLYFLVAFALISISSFAQTVKLKLAESQVNTNVNGLPINKGDEFIVQVWVDGNNNSNTRSLYFDFEFNNTAFELVSITHTGTLGNGGALPYGSQISLDTYQYPGYSWLSTQQNSTTNGNTNYQYANYNYINGGPKTIIRSQLTWAISSGTPGAWYLLNLRFKLKTTAPGYSWDPIKMNFGAAFNQNGSAGSTIMEQQLTTIVGLDPVATSYINGSLELNPLLNNITAPKVAFIDTLTNQGPIFDVNSDGKINIIQSQLSANTTYRVMAMINMDKLYDVYNAAVTVSDYTAAQSEFISQNLDGTFKNQNIRTGIGYFSADINRNKNFDGGDVTKIFSQSVSVDKLVSIPEGYTVGSNGYMSVPTFKADEFNKLDVTNWKQSLSYVIFKTGNIGTNLPLALKYVLFGDINRSHSSQVIDIQGNIKASLASASFINTQITSIPNINVTLSNLVITSNDIEIPIAVSTAASKISALQFEFTYDETKIKFNELLSSLPNGWFVFGTPVNGKIKFGAIDKELKNSISGDSVPFKLKFTSLNNGSDITTQIKVSSIMDASDNLGNQVGITLNSTTIKLTGYNKFNN